MAFKHNRQRWDDALSRMDPTAFEALLAEHFRSKGYRVDHVGAAASGQRYDGGIDLRLYRGGEFIIVQCKRWNAYQVPHNDVHELLGVMLTERASAAILVSSGEFTAAARSAAARSDKLQLIDGAGLRAVLDADAVAAVSATARNPLPSFAAQGRRSRAGPAAAGTGVLKSIAALVLMVVVIGACASAYHAWRKPLSMRTATATPAATPTAAPGAAPVPRARPSPLRSELSFAVADQMQRTASAALLIPDARRRIDPEAARAAARKLAGIRSAVWMDASHLIVRVDTAALRSFATIDAVCQALEPLGDTLAVIVAVQNATATNGDEMQSLVRNCQLPEGRRALMQAHRQIDTVSPQLRAQFKAMQEPPPEPAAASQ